MLDKLPNTITELRILAMLSNDKLITLTDDEKILAWDNVYNPTIPQPEPFEPEPESEPFEPESEPFELRYNPYSYLDKLEYKTSHTINIAWYTIDNIRKLDSLRN